MEFLDIVRGWAALLISAGALVYAIVSARSRAKKAEQEELNGRVKALELSHVAKADLDAAKERIVYVEGQIKTSADAADRVAKLESARSHDLEIHAQAFETARGRIQGVEDALKHVPSKDEFHELSLSVRDMVGQIGKLAEAMKPLTRSIDRIDDFLMGQVSRGQR